MSTNEVKLNEQEMVNGGGAIGGQYLGRMGDEGASNRNRTSDNVSKVFFPLLLINFIPELLSLNKRLLHF